MEKIIGNLIVLENDTRDFNKLKEVTGSVYVCQGAKFTAPVLATVGGSVYVHQGAKFTAPVLATVGGYVYVHQGAKFTAPVLATVGGSVDVRQGAKFTAPVLATVGGSVYVHQGAKFTAPVLATVGGYVDVCQGAKFTAPVLATVGGYVDVCQGAKFTAPVLATVGGSVYVQDGAKLNVKFLNKVNYIVADGKAFLIESQKTSKGITIYSGFNIKGVKNCKITKHETIYLASKYNFFAHGETVKKAVEDLQFKIVSEKLKNEPIKEDTVLTIQYYRLLTGACELGVKQWMRENKIDEGIKASELLPILIKTNAYGLEKFKKLITF